MFWLMGGKAFLMAIAGLGLGVVSDVLKYQLTHSPWEGLRYYDLIWPSFMLMVGVSIAVLVGAERNMARRLEAGRRVVPARARCANRCSTGKPYLIELSSALQPIAIAYVVASLPVGAFGTDRRSPPPPGSWPDMRCCWRSFPRRAFPRARTNRTTTWSPSWTRR